jgi:transcriptional regulator with XRE-family HTH domain
MNTVKVMHLFRRKHGISLRELARAAHTSHQYLSAVELGAVGTTEETRASICHAFELVIDKRQSKTTTLSSDYTKYKEHLFETTSGKEVSL